VPTRTDLRQTVAEEATIASSGETMSAEDYEYVERRIDSKLAYLLDEGLLPFDIEGEIPQKYLLPVARVIAAECANGFGMDVQKAEALGLKGMRELRRMKSKPRFGTPNKSTYY
jgi:hypothetical protein